MTAMIVKKASVQPTTIDIIMGKNKILDSGSDPRSFVMFKGRAVDRREGRAPERGMLPDP